MSREIDDKSRKIHNPHGGFDKPSDVVKDSGLSRTDKKKKALEDLEQDAHQLITANNEGMAPENDRIAENEPKLDEVVKAQQRIGEKPKNKPTQ
jgi:Cft2 family RNA processing exonuclease